MGIAHVMKCKVFSNLQNILCFKSVYCVLVGHSSLLSVLKPALHDASLLKLGLCGGTRRIF
jgi:hypothetical protein